MSLEAMWVVAKDYMFKNEKKKKMERNSELTRPL